MPSTESSILVNLKTTKYKWPATQLNAWLFFMIVGSSAILSIFSSFAFIQRQLRIGIPWFFSYWITVGTITDIFILAMLGLIAQRQLLPGIVIMGSFILLILWVIGLFVISLELWGPTGNVNPNCQLYVETHPVSGTSLGTMVWLQQHGICQAWQAAWSLQLIGSIFFIWIIYMAYEVYRNGN